MDLCKGFTQGGSNADVVLADTFVKGFTNGIDWETGYEAVVKDAECESSLSYYPNNSNGGMQLRRRYGQLKAAEVSPAGKV